MLSAPAHHINLSRNISVQKRHNLTSHFTKVQNALLYAADFISDGAFRTYAVLISHDFQDSATRRYKGAVTVSIETLMCLRGKGRSTLYSHLQELEEAGLITLTPTGIELYQLDGASPEEADCGPMNGRELAEDSLKVQISGQDIKEIEEEKNITNTVQYSEVEEMKKQFVARKLSDLSLPEGVAPQFIERYGVEQVYTQVINLSRQQSHGIVVHKPLQWLQSALARDYALYTPPSKSLPSGTPAPTPQPHHSSSGHFEEIVAYGRTETIWVIDDPADLAPAPNLDNTHTLHVKPTTSVDDTYTHTPTTQPCFSTATSAPNLQAPQPCLTDIIATPSHSPRTLPPSPKPGQISRYCKSLSAMKTPQQDTEKSTNCPAFSLSTYPCISQMQECGSKSAGHFLPHILAASHIECSRRARREESTHSYPG